MQPSQPLIYPVRIERIDRDPSGELSDQINWKCYFCEKLCRSASEESRFACQLSGQPGSFYCGFCVRHGFHTRGSRDVFMLSFRGVIAHLYRQNYLSGSGRKMWLAEIEGLVGAHRRVGEKNPLFIYDPETLLWFVNFARVGRTPRKMALEEIHKTVADILASFDLPTNIPGFDQTPLLKKYKSAIDGFHHKRRRHTFIPTLADHDEFARNFTADELRIKTVLTAGEKPI